MSTVQEQIFITLGQFSGLSGLVAARIYPDVAPADVAVPYVVWQEVSAVPQNGLDGHHGLDDVRIQVVSFGRTALQARATAEQVRQAMRAGTQFASREVDYASADMELGTKLFGMRSDFSLWFRS